MFFKFSQNFQKKAFVEVSFLIKLQAQSENFIKIEVLAQMFSCHLFKICQNIYKRLLLYLQLTASNHATNHHIITFFAHKVIELLIYPKFAISLFQKIFLLFVFISLDFFLGCVFCVIRISWQYPASKTCVQSVLRAALLTIWK